MKPGFVNRVDEVGVVANFLKQPQFGPRIQLFTASPRSGISSFLKHCTQIQANNDIALYVDGANQVGNSIFSQILVGLYNSYPILWNKFQSYQEKKIGKGATREVALAAMNCIPYVGPGLAQLTQGLSQTFPVSAFPSVAAEIICEFIIHISDQYRVILFIDNVQELDDWSSQLLATTVGQAYKNLKYVIGYTSNSHSNYKAVDDFAIQISDFGYRVGMESFASPDEHFISCYAQACNVNLTRFQVNSIAAAASGDIYRVRAALVKASAFGRDMVSNLGDISATSSFILSLLAIAKQDLRKTDIVTLTMLDDSIFIPNEEHVNSDIRLLSSTGIISLHSLPDGDELIKLIPSSNVVNEELNYKYSDLLHVHAVLYNYYSRVKNNSIRHSTAEVAPLLYRLAKIVDKENLGERLKDIISYSLQMGSRSSAEEFVFRAIEISDDNYSDFNDLVAMLAFLVSIKKYKKILEILDGIKNKHWIKNKICKAFKGIALNRQRRHKESEAVLAELCEKAGSIEEVSLFASFRIVGYLHDNNTESALALYNKYKPIVSSSANFGYFLRNSAEVFTSDMAIDILDEAFEHHVKNGDRFGQATTLCNRGAKLVQFGRAKEGLEDVKKAKELLEIFGINHLGIVTANIGHCQLYLGLFEESERFLNKALRYMDRDLPWAYAMINLATALLFQGRKNDAVQTINKVIQMAKDAKLDRICQKTYFNGALVHLWAGSDMAIIDECCTHASNHLDRHGAYNTPDKIEVIRELTKSRASLTESLFFDLYSPCASSYWYQNPLEGIPGNTLAIETIS